MNRSNGRMMYGKTENANLEENVLQCNFVHPESHLKSPGIDPEAPQELLSA
jgi:hypothetical protein